MTRELDQQQAFQTHCLAQMGVTVWMPASADVVGNVFYSPQPWAMDQGFEPIVDSTVADIPARQGFGSSVSAPERKAVAPEEKEQSVANLRQQLNAGPEIVVEDLQPIEELAVDIEVPVALGTAKSTITHIDLRGYLFDHQLLILSEVPSAFSQQEDVDRLACKMAQALLKLPLDEWDSRGLSWPGGLKNPHFLSRQDWLLGAIESFVLGLAKPFSRDLKVVLAGDKIANLYDELAADSVIKACPVARIVSLPELYRIPELRKDAWQVMQQALFNKQ